jgi:hypothetical protein
MLDASIAALRPAKPDPMTATSHILVAAAANGFVLVCNDLCGDAFGQKTQRKLLKVMVTIVNGSIFCKRRGKKNTSLFMQARMLLIPHAQITTFAPKPHFCEVSRHDWRAVVRHVSLKDL